MNAQLEPDGAVEFRQPPLNEVVFSVQFEAPVIDEVGILSEFWPEIRTEFPEHERHPPLMPAAETFDVAPPQPAIQLLPFASGMPQRYWFLSPDRTLIVQAQPDRLLFNWRQVTGEEVYPRFDTLAPRFLELLATFLGCRSVDVDAARAAWIELQYINPIQVQAAGETHGQLARVLTFLEQDPPRDVLPPVEDTQLQQRFRISADDGTPIGRLYLTAVPALRPTDQAPVYVVTLLARGRPGDGDLRTGVSEFLGVAHNLIVHGFREVTTEEMHRQWGAQWLA